MSLPGKSHGKSSLVGYSPWGLKESDMTSLSLSQKVTEAKTAVYKSVIYYRNNDM